MACHCRLQHSREHYGCSGATFVKSQRLNDFRKMPVDIVGYIYAAAIAAGGIAGYVKAGMMNEDSHFLAGL